MKPVNAKNFFFVLILAIMVAGVFFLSRGWSPSVDANAQETGPKELKVEVVAEDCGPRDCFRVVIINGSVPCVLYGADWDGGISCDFESGLGSSLLEGLRP